MHPAIKSQYATIEGTKIHYLIAGSGTPILFIHGFPTGAYLWRNIMKELLDSYQVIAIDLPGYGKSDKKLDDSYSFRYYNRILNGLLEHLSLETITLGVHDAGGPIGLYWMLKHMSKVDRLILFNTLVYPNFSWAVKLFAFATITPGLKQLITSSFGIKKSLQIGLYNKEKLSPEATLAYQAPFGNKTAKKALLKSVQRLSLKGFKEIGDNIHLFTGPIQVIYGEHDRILPNVAQTMERVKTALPQTRLASISKCGHFLQEEQPEKIADIIKDFMENSAISPD